MRRDLSVRTEVYLADIYVFELSKVNASVWQWRVSSEKKKKKIPHRQLGPLRGSSSPWRHFEPARAKPN